ncbi:MAG: hypothetical protein GY839_15045 [candidate division Zixibacteria bacterium]|nr:hypothetical protein [candidate division Zixibacteria bacterium]
MTGKLKSLTWLGATTILAMMLFIGCSSENILVDDDNSIDLAAIESVDFARDLGEDGLAKGGTVPVLGGYAIAKQKFDENGGYLQLQLDNEDIYFVIPEYALTELVEIEIRGEVWKTENGLVYYYTCAPAGLVFQRPITLKQVFESGSRYEGLYWYNPASASWIVTDVEKVKNGNANFEIHHFSKYAISD